MRLAREGQNAPETISYETVAVDTVEEDVQARLITKFDVENSVFIDAPSVSAV